MDPFLGQITMFGFNFAPRGWANCAGQFLSIASYSALYSLLGTVYGGDGKSTFALPDLRGRCPVNFGQGPGLSDYRIGQRGGMETTTHTIQNMPSHSHVATLEAEGAAASSLNPLDRMLAGANIYADAGASGNRAMNAESITVANTGGGVPTNNLQPYLAVNVCIALTGVYPSRS